MSAITTIDQLTQINGGFTPPPTLSECAAALHQSTKTVDPLFLVGFLRSFLILESHMFPRWTELCQTHYPHELFLLSRLSEESFGGVSEPVSVIALLVQKAYSIIGKTPYSTDEVELFQEATNMIQFFRQTVAYVHSEQAGWGDPTTLLTLKNDLIQSFRTFINKMAVALQKLVL